MSSKLLATFNWQCSLQWLQVFIAEVLRCITGTACVPADEFDKANLMKASTQGSQICMPTNMGSLLLSCKR